MSPIIACKMRLFTILFLIAATTDAKKHRKGKPHPKISQENSDMLKTYEFRRSDDPIGDKYVNPVPFGHIFREGYEDPRSNFKRPIDLLELDTRYVTDGPYAREFIKKHPHKVMVLNENLANQLRPTKSLNAAPPANFEKTNIKRVHGSPLDNKEINDTIQTFWNLEGILTRNLEDPPKYRLGGGKMPQIKRTDDEGPNIPLDKKFDFFSKQSYVLREEIEAKRKMLNFTTCDEFGKHAKFHPNDIINIDWVPFYIWTNDKTGVVGVSRIHQFSFPTKKFVQNFKENYGSYINKTVDWEQPKLILRHDDRELLLVAIDRSGLFDAIPYTNLPIDANINNSWFKIPTMPTRLKIVDPYLALMYCDLPYAVIMAISGSEPKSPRQCTSEAAVLKFKGRGFPVARDLYTEAQEARARAAAAVEREQSKFIFVDQ